MNLKQVFSIIKEHEIIRRYVVINSFDGALTIFGIILVNYVAGIMNPSMIILPSIGAAIAMCVSGMWGAYAAESAEVTKKMKVLEKHMLRKLHTSKRVLEDKKINFLVGIVDGFSPLITSFIIIIPFFLAKAQIILMVHAYYAAMAIIAAFLFILGVFLGKIAKENIYKNGLKMLFAGAIIAFIFYLLSFFGIL